MCGGAPQDLVALWNDPLEAGFWLESKVLRRRCRPVRFFLRGVAPLSFKDWKAEFCRGERVEVCQEDHDKCVRGFFEGLSVEPSFAAKLAKNIAGFGDTLGLSVLARFGATGQ